MKQFRVILSFFLVCTGLFFCAASPVTAQTGSSVWKISKGGKTLFLGGSIHILRETDFPLPAEFDNAFSQSTILILETDIDQMENPKTLQYLMSRVNLPGNKTLKTILDPDTYKMLEAEFSKYGFPINNVSKLKPSMVMNVLAVLQMEKVGYTQQGVDHHYLDKAKTAKKTVQFLETVKFQIDALVGMGEGYENDFIRYSLYEMKNTEAELEALLAEWKTGGTIFSEAYLKAMKEQWPVIYKTLVTDRNRAWMPKIKKFLASRQVYFVVVGLLHLHGTDGLLRQLEDFGCTIEQLK